MAKHHFGIMEKAPVSGERYDKFEPHVYKCISAEDALIEGVEPQLRTLRMYWHTKDFCADGLNTCGITLIPPESLDGFISAVRLEEGLAELGRMLLKANAEHKWVIHFGL